MLLPHHLQADHALEGAFRQLLNQLFSNAQVTAVLSLGGGGNVGRLMARLSGDIAIKYNMRIGNDSDERRTIRSLTS